MAEEATLKEEIDMTTLEKIEQLAVWMMGSEGMPSLLINAPEDREDFWRVYPSKHPAIGVGKTLSEAVSIAHDTMTLHQVLGNG
jgi:hypothetical protein